MNSYKFILAVQGEGRGHLTQAIAVFELLKKAGHKVSCVTVGLNMERQIPDFFIRKINVPIIRIASPNFVKDRNNRSVSLVRTVTANLFMIRKWNRSLEIIKGLIDEYRPDVVINFYEPLMGCYALRYPHPPFCIISIAHQYTYLHNQYRFPRGNRLQSLMIRLYTKLTAYGSHKILAISMKDMQQATNPKLLVIPPILRKELFQQEVKQEDFILVYVLNSGYIPDIIDWHRKHPSIALYCFTDSAEVKEDHKGEWEISQNLTFYSLNDKKFLELMAKCKGLVCSAGFESVCEAMYLGKPVMMVPVERHYEQYCNAQDGAKAGAGFYSAKFALGKMENYFLFHRNPHTQVYREWVNTSEYLLMQAISSLSVTEPAPSNHETAHDILPNYIDQLTVPSFSSFKDMPSV